MISKGTLDALSVRVDFTYRVGEKIGEALDDFLNTPQGQNFEWRDNRTIEKFGEVHGSIKSKTKPQETEKSSVSLSLDSGGSVVIELNDWTMSDLGDWEEISRSIDFRLGHEQTVDEAAAHVISEMMSSGRKFGVALRNHIEAQLSNQPSPGFQPEP